MNLPLWQILLQAIWFLGLPWLLLQGSKRYKLIQWLSPVFFCYLLGILAGQWWPFNGDNDFGHLMTQATVLLAIPLLLFATDFVQLRKLGPTMLKAFGLWLIILMVMAFVARQIHPTYPDFPKYLGMIVGVYTGGTANLAAIGIAQGVEESIIAQLNASDLVLSGIYLILLLGLGTRLGQWLSGKNTIEEVNPNQSHADIPETNSPTIKIIDILKGIGVAVLVILQAVGLSMLVTGGIDELLVMIALPLLALVQTLWKPVRRIPHTTEMGDYLMMVFCVVIGSQVNIATFFEQAGTLFLIMGSILGLSLLLFFVLGKLFKLPGEELIITTVAGVFGPPFIAPVASSLNNPTLVPIGLCIAVLGLALGNYTGLITIWFCN